MYKTYQALKDVVKIVADLLLEADLVEGLSLTPEQIKSENKPIFWYINTRSKEASEKETYITYSIIDLKPNEYGDGKIISRVPSVIINVYSRERNINEIIENLNNVFVDNFWTFELQNIGFDNGTQSYNYTFICQAVVVND